MLLSVVVLCERKKNHAAEDAAQVETKKNAFAAPLFLSLLHAFSLLSIRA